MLIVFKLHENDLFLLIHFRDFKPFRLIYEIKFICDLNK